MAMKAKPRVGTMSRDVEGADSTVALPRYLGPHGTHALLWDASLIADLRHIRF